MDSRTHNGARRPLLAAVGVLVLAALVGVSVVIAPQLVHGDLRINQVHHFGGDAIYCVDRDLNPTTQYSDDGLGGFRLLNLQGQELGFIPAEQIHQTTEMALASGGGVFVGSMQGSYGPFNIWT